MNKATLFLVLFICATLGIAETKPVLIWNFKKSNDELNSGIKGQLKGGALIKNGILILNGTGAYFISDPLNIPLKAKSLYVSCRLGRLNQEQVQLASISGLKGVPTIKQPAAVMYPFLLM